jgi:hypothetical protein
MDDPILYPGWELGSLIEFSQYTLTDIGRGG